MDWGSLISSVLPTIGTVMGGLLGANRIEDGIIHFAHKGVMGAQQGFSSDIYCEEGNYYLFNQSTSKDDIVTLTFPSRGQTGAETVMVPGRQSFNITPLFQENAVNDNSQFELIACHTGAQNGVMGAQQAGIKISSSGQGLQVGGQKKAIGAYLQVQVKPQQITVFPQNGVVLQSLPMVSVQGSGDTGIRVMDAVGEAQAIVIDLPQPLGANDTVTVDVVANVKAQTNSENMIMSQKHAALLCSPSESVIERIKNAPRLNWGEEK